MSNEVKQEDRIPEHIWIEEVWITDAIQVHYNPTRKEPKEGFCEYVRADLLATVRREAFKEAIQWARRVQAVKTDAARDAQCDDEFAAMRLSHEATGAERVVETLEAALEASANQKGEMKHD